MLAAILLLSAMALPALNGQVVEDAPAHSIPQNSPCPDQPTSLAALKKAFAAARIPTPSEMTGTWVGVGAFIGKSFRSVNCQGLKRGKLFEEVIVASGYSLTTHFIGTNEQSVDAAADKTRSLAFRFDYGATLVCLFDTYGQANEFKKMPVRAEELAPRRAY
jgi:hypothetical protein